MEMVKNNEKVMLITLDQLQPRNDQERALFAALGSYRTAQDALIELREQLGLTQSDIAERLGTSQPMVSKIENSQTGLQIGSFISYAAAIGASIRFEVTPPAN
jgi:DNA-binding transcriptional regulator YiaG